MARYALNILIFIISFPILINFYLKNPSEFYFQFGIDPELVKNLPTGVAEEIHCTTCVICTEDIQIGEELYYDYAPDISDSKLKQERLMK